MRKCGTVLSACKCRTLEIWQGLDVAAPAYLSCLPWASHKRLTNEKNLHSPPKSIHELIWQCSAAQLWLLRWPCPVRGLGPRGHRLHRGDTAWSCPWPQGLPARSYKGGHQRQRAGARLLLLLQHRTGSNGHKPTGGMFRVVRKKTFPP